MYLTFSSFISVSLSVLLCFSIEFMFVHSNGGQGWPSKPHPLRPHRIWDDHCRSCCQDSQNTASRGHHGGKVSSQAVQIYSLLHSCDLLNIHLWFINNHLVRCSQHRQGKIYLYLYNLNLTKLVQLFNNDTIVISTETVPHQWQPSWSLMKMPHWPKRPCSVSNLAHIR